MSLRKLTDNLNNVSSLPNKPSLSSEELKAVFDKAGNDIKDYINDILTDEIEKLIVTTVNANKTAVENVLTSTSSVNALSAGQGKVLKSSVDGVKLSIDEIKKSVYTAQFNKIYPVGSVYMSVNSVNPNVLFGGTWTQLKDRFLLGVGDTYKTVNATGGESTVSLTVEQIPSHKHQLSADAWGNTPGAFQTRTSSNTGNYSGSVRETKNTGGGKAHNNMPPYLVVYMWKRTA